MHPAGELDGSEWHHCWELWPLLQLHGLLIALLLLLVLLLL